MLEIAGVLALLLSAATPATPCPSRAHAHSPVQRLLFFLQSFLETRSPPYPEPPPNATAVCPLAGRACERHEVRTADGYLLSLIRILGSRRGAPAVLVQHGFLESSSTFLIRRDGSDLGYLLQDAGFDVWLGNFRGATYSRRHVTLDPDKNRKFWNFSFHEMGLYDLPALVDHILGRTGLASLQYVGHSMGATALLVMLSSRPSYNAKVHLASLMAPVVTVNKQGSWLYGALVRNARAVREWLYGHQVVELGRRNPLLHFVADTLCGRQSIFASVCTALYESFVGASARPRVPDLLPKLLAFHPAGSSTRTMEHYGAVTISRRFRPLGKGLLDANPGGDYNLTAITTPLAIYYSKTDALADPQEVERWSARCPSVMRRYRVPLDTFNHVDFIFAARASPAVLQPLIKLMRDARKDSIASFKRTNNY